MIIVIAAILSLAVILLAYKVEKQNDEILLLWHYLNKEKDDSTD